MSLRWSGVLAACLLACGSHDRAPAAADASDEGGYETIVNPVVDTDDGSATDDAGESSPAAGPPFDAGEGGVCASPLAAGDLVIDELMIASVAGAGDYGEWIEVRSALGCAVNVAGLHGESPHGSKVAAFDVPGDLWIPAGGGFVVADSEDPAINHSLPGTVLVWSGGSGDVLRNKGGTASLWMNGTLVDSVTYPSLPLVVGSSLAFPADCANRDRSDFSKWQTSSASWFPGFHGTPNAPNDDVHCP